MLTWESTVEAQALYARGWTKSAIARHLGINRRTVREYLKRRTRPRLGRPAAPPPPAASPGSRWYPLRVRRPANDQVTVLPQVHDSAEYRPAPRSLRRHSPAPPGSSSDVAASSSAAATRGGMAAVTACARTVCP